jgi:hypothetical protein
LVFVLFKEVFMKRPLVAVFYFLVFGGLAIAQVPPRRPVVPYPPAGPSKNPDSAASSKSTDNSTFSNSECEQLRRDVGKLNDLVAAQDAKILLLEEKLKLVGGK